MDLDRRHGGCAVLCCAYGYGYAYAYSRYRGYLSTYINLDFIFKV